MGRTGTGGRKEIRAEQARTGGNKRHATASWDWETSRYGVGNHGANNGEPGHRKPANSPELQEGREVSAGVRDDPEAPWSKA